MKNKPVIPNWLSIILLIACAAAFVTDIFAIVFNYAEGPGAINYYWAFITILMVEFYTIFGYKKDARLFFKLALIDMMIMDFFSIAVATIYELPSVMHILVMFSSIMFAGLAMLVFTADIGRRKSMVITIVVFLAALVRAVYVAIQGYFLWALPVYVRALLAIIMYIMVYAKYKDKAQRGSK